MYVLIVWNKPRKVHKNCLRVKTYQDNAFEINYASFSLIHVLIYKCPDATLGLHSNWFTEMWLGIWQKSVLETISHRCRKYLLHGSLDIGQTNTAVLSSVHKGAIIFQIRPSTQNDDTIANTVIFVQSVNHPWNRLYLFNLIFNQWNLISKDSICVITKEYCSCLWLSFLKINM